MGKTSTKINNLSKRVAKLEEETSRQHRKLKDIDNRVDILTDSKILEMLAEQNSSYSDRPRYTYDEISNATGKSTSYISNLAKENNLNRRGLKAVK